MRNKKGQDNSKAQKPPKQHYSVMEKKQIVEKVIRGIYTSKEALEHYGIGDRTLDSWLITFATEEEHLAFKRRIHDKSHRRIVASQVFSGLLSTNEAARQNKVSGSTIRGWVAQYQSSNNLVAENMQQEMSLSPVEKETQRQVEELKMKVIALETMIDLAEEQYKIDIRKKCGTKQQ